jgi:predicted nucleotidyltransferase
MELTAMSLTVQLGDAHVDAAQLADLCQRFGVTKLALFGSAVRGQMRPDSDIDVMVEFDPAARIGILKFESLAEGLEALVGRKIDLVTKRGLKPWVRPEVLREARVVYAA